MLRTNLRVTSLTFLFFFVLFSNIDNRCDRCVLKMDHHCIWINNCVGLYNYKHFFQLLCYGIVGTSFIGTILSWRIIQVGVRSWQDNVRVCGMGVSAFTLRGVLIYLPQVLYHGAGQVEVWQLVILFVALVFALLQVGNVMLSMSNRASWSNRKK